jgi:hypothetical protein
MRRAVAAFIAAYPAAALAEVDVSRDADCLMVVEGQELIRGRCSFTPIDTDGSFIVSGLNGKFFAYVVVDRPGRAEGYWNGVAYGSHAHDPLGTLYREDACWVNDIASVCAW